MKKLERAGLKKSISFSGGSTKYVVLKWVVLLWVLCVNEAYIQICRGMSLVHGLLMLTVPYIIKLWPEIYILKPYLFTIFIEHQTHLTTELLFDSVSLLVCWQIIPDLSLDIQNTWINWGLRVLMFAQLLNISCSVSSTELCSCLSLPPSQ